MTWVNIDHIVSYYILFTHHYGCALQIVWFRHSSIDCIYTFNLFLSMIFLLLDSEWRTWKKEVPFTFWSIMICFSFVQIFCLKNKQNTVWKVLLISVFREVYDTCLCRYLLWNIDVFLHIDAITGYFILYSFSFYFRHFICSLENTQYEVLLE
jgi:hypothetical protein